MNTYNNYIDYLIKNYPLQSESSDTESNILIGGKNDNIKNKNNDYPSGYQVLCYNCNQGKAIVLQ